MPFTFTMPKLSPTMEEGTIAKWHKKEGDKVEAGETLIEVLTDKATVEHHSLDPGYLRKILVKEGETAYVNQPLAILTKTKDEDISGYQVVEKKEKEEKKTEEKVERKQKPVQKEQGVSMAQPSFVLEEPLKDYRFPFPVGEVPKTVKASPLVKKIAKEKNIDLSTIKGSGPGGRIVKRDLDLAQEKGVAVTIGYRKAPKDMPGSYEEIPLTPMRKAIASRLQQAKTFIPHFYVTQEIDACPMIDLREQLKHQGVKVTYNDFMIKAVAIALKKHPNVNAAFNQTNQTIAQFKTVDIAVAVGIDEGLITPIIRYADLKNLGEISIEIKELAKRAKEGKLQEQEYKGGGFTISNLGMFHIKNFQAILNPPQAAILAVSAILDVPVVQNHQIVPGKRLNLTLSCDHRVIDGVLAAKFLNTLKSILESPAVLLL